jgi:DNA-binding transcriptional MerR regulator
MLDVLARQASLDFTVESLAEAANAAIGAGGPTTSDGRVADSIDVRTVRFYQGLGIVPRPAYRGRTAIYRFDHLVRLIAARMLQAEGHTLAQVQSAMASRSTDELVAALSATTAPARPSVATPGRVASNQSSPASGQRSGDLRAVQLAPGITILIDPASVPNTDAVISAARAAIQTLAPTTRRPSNGATP